MSPTGPALWDTAPCGLLVLRPDGVVVHANAAVLGWTGRTLADLAGRATLASLLSVGGRIFWETHLAPLLLVERRVDEVVLELRTAAGRLPVLLSAVVAPEGEVHVALSSARERATFERELVLARRGADQSAARLRALQATTAALSAAVGVDAVTGVLLDTAVERFGARAATVWVHDEDSGLVVHAARGEEPAGRAPGTDGQDGAVRDGGRVVVPLHGHASHDGVLSLLPGDEDVDPLDLSLLTVVGQQGGLALDRARRHEHAAGVARELQHSLLAVEVPDDPRFDVATVYRAGIELLEVGGDWSDVFLVEEGLLAVVVGDVVGRGLAAASAMGQLRSAVRALAAPGVGPAELLRRLDRFVGLVDAAAMATLVYAELDLATGLLRYACAGHPPPLLVAADGRTRLLWEGRSTPLGSFVSAGVREQAEVLLCPADRLVLYTDGLVERRERDLDDGFEALARAATGLAGLPLQEAADHLTRLLLHDETTRDDVCVLVLDAVGDGFVQHLRADLASLSDLRRRLGAWLDGHGVDGDARDDLVLAASEVVANAAEHGSGLQADAWVGLRAGVRERELLVVVEDGGSWRPGGGSPERGRGLQIARALVDDVQVEAGAGTRVLLRTRTGDSR